MTQPPRASRAGIAFGSADRRRAGTYHDDWFAEAYHEHWAPVLASPAIDLLDRLQAAGATPGETGRILDIGAGTGLLTIELARRWPTATVVATDPARAMLEVTRRRAAEAGIASSRLELVEARAEELPLAERSVGLAASSFVFQMVTDRGVALREGLRVLVPGGWFGYVTWLAGDRTFAPSVAVDAVLGEETNVDWSGGAPRVGDVPSPEVAEAELRDAGFDQVRVSAGRLRKRWSIDAYLAHVEGCRNTMAFANLGEDEAGDLRRRLRQAVADLPLDAFSQGGDLVYALAVAPDGRPPGMGES